MVTAQKIRVLIVDDHVMVRQGLRAVLQSYPNIDVVGEAGNGEEALSSVAKLQPTIVVMDISMPSLDGIGATRLIKTQYPQIAVLGLSVNAPSYHVDAMLKAGAFDVITKEKAVDELYSAIQRATAAIQPILILQEQPPASVEQTGAAQPAEAPRDIRCHAGKNAKSAQDLAVTSARKATLLPSSFCLPIDRLQCFQLKREFCDASIALAYLPLKRLHHRRLSAHRLDPAAVGRLGQVLGEVLG